MTQFDYTISLGTTSTPHEHFNYVTMKKDEEDLADSEEVPRQEGRETTMVGSKESNYGGNTAAFVENDSIQIHTIFPPKLPVPCNFPIPLLTTVC